MKKVIVFGTFDSKHEELWFLVECLRQNGLESLCVDVSMKGESTAPVDVSAARVAAAAGYPDLASMRKEKKRDENLLAMATGAARLIKEQVDSGLFSGAISIGGGQGSVIAGMVMRELPVGFPKVIVSTMATVGFAQRSFAGVNDTFIINPLVDVSGLNPILISVLQKAALSLVAMAFGDCSLSFPQGQKRVGITMWGVTTPCVDRVRALLEKQGCEVYVFHANYMGGRTFEKLCEQGFFHAVADLTLSEITQSISTGENADIIDLRLTSAGLKGIPQVVSTGGADMVNCPPSNIPEDRTDRKRYYHTPVSLFLRSSKEENEKFAEVIGDKLNAARGPVTLLLPLRGTSAVNIEGGAFHDPEIDAALFNGLKQRVRAPVTVKEIDCHINDPLFAEQVADALLSMLT